MDLPFGLSYCPLWCATHQLRALDLDIPLNVRGDPPFFMRP